jgi:hypothetical protein
MDPVDFIFGVAGLFMLFGLGTMGLFVYLIIRWSTKKPQGKELVQDHQQMKAKVDAKKGDLIIWGDHTYKDLTFCMYCKFVKTVERRLSGQVFNHDNKKLVAFQRVERGFTADGYYYASSTDWDIRCEFDTKQFKFFYNNELVGWVHLPTGGIYNAQKEKIGEAKHPKKMSVDVGPIRYRAGEENFPVTLNGRVLCTISAAPDYSDLVPGAFFRINENWITTPIFNMFNEPETEEEKKWLLLLGVHEVVFHGHWMI